MEELQGRHRKEQKDLQARMTQKKKSATKKTRKGVNDECDRLQRELLERQTAEIAQLSGEGDSLVDRMTDVNLDNITDEKEPNGVPAVNEDEDTERAAKEAQAEPQSQPQKGKKPNRQKARLARRAAEQEAQAAAAAEEAAQQTDNRGNERESMEKEFSRLGLRELEIRPDGHCLYSSVACQLVAINGGDDTDGLRPDPSRIVLSSATRSRIDTVASPKDDGYRAVRAVVADFLLENKDDFAPFMEESIDEYARKIRLTSEWGGDLELQAIARAYGVEINVVQADGRVVKFESGSDGDPERKIWLAYYRHTYGLGEHYNALMLKT